MSEGSKLLAGCYGHRREEMKKEGFYLKFDNIADVPIEVLENYWNRKNRFAIVRFSEDNWLVFLVSDQKKPQIPGYPATAIERFKTHEEAVKTIKEHYLKLKYEPENQEYGYWTGGLHNEPK